MKKKLDWSWRCEEEIVFTYLYLLYWKSKNCFLCWGLLVILNLFQGIKRRLEWDTTCWSAFILSKINNSRQPNWCHWKRGWAKLCYFWSDFHSFNWHLIISNKTRHFLWNVRKLTCEKRGHIFFLRIKGSYRHTHTHIYIYKWTCKESWLLFWGLMARTWRMEPFRKGTDSSSNQICRRWFCCSDMDHTKEGYTHSLPISNYWYLWQKGENINLIFVNLASFCWRA